MNTAATTLTINGTFSNSGTLTANAFTTTVTYNGASQTIAPGLYYNLTFAGSGTPVLSPTGTIAIARYIYTYSNSFIHMQGCTINFNGTAAQTIPAAATGFAYFNNLTLSSYSIKYFGRSNNCLRKYDNQYTNIYRCSIGNNRKCGRNFDPLEAQQPIMLHILVHLPYLYF